MSDGCICPAFRFNGVLLVNPKCPIHGAGEVNHAN